jgi:adenosine deaminase
MLSKKAADWLKSLPKIELHAHLFGSVTRTQLLQLLADKNLHHDVQEYTSIISEDASLNLQTIFSKSFTYLPKVIRNTADLSKMTRMVIQNFVDDNVVYLELRSSPKKLEDCDVAGYFKSIIDVAKSREHQITVRVLVSINRDYPAAAYLGLVDEIRKIPEWQKYIVGFDFSGNPEKNSFKDYVDILTEARQAGFKITIHTPEVDHNVGEVTDIVNFRPERLGHFLFYQDDHLKKTLELQIPIEICPTSNFVVGTSKSHHFVELVKSGLQRYTICTDDLLLFDSSLSNEWTIFSDQAQISQSEVIEKVKASVDFIFDDSAKDSIREIFNQEFNRTD